MTIAQRAQLLFGRPRNDDRDLVDQVDDTEDEGLADFTSDSYQEGYLAGLYAGAKHLDGRDAYYADKLRDLAQEYMEDHGVAFDEADL